MSPTSSKKTPFAFNTFIQLLFSTWSLSRTLEGNKSHNCAANPAEIQNFPKYMSYQLLVHYGPIISKAGFKNYREAE
jgi:hypothetical protein